MIDIKIYDKNPFKGKASITSGDPFEVIDVKVDDVTGAVFQGTTQLGSVVFQTERNDNFLNKIFVRILKQKSHF